MREYLYFAFLLTLTIILCECVFQDRDQVIENAIKENNGLYQKHESVRPNRHKETKPRLTREKRICHNLLDQPKIQQAKESIDLDVSDELSFCGQLTTPISKLKRVSSIARMAKNSIEILSKHLGSKGKKTKRGARSKRTIFGTGTPMENTQNAKITEYPWTVQIFLAWNVTVTYSVGGYSQLPEGDNCVGGVYGGGGFDGGSDGRVYHGITIYDGFTCTGSIFHRYFVLTAAHCIPSRHLAMDKILLKADYNKMGEKYQKSYAEKQKEYREKLNRILPKNQQLDNTSRITDVKEYVIDRIEIYYWLEKGLNRIFNRDNNLPHIKLEEKHLKGYPGYLTDEEMKVMFDDERQIRFNVPAEAPPKHDINDVAIIYTGRDNPFPFDTKRVIPICLPYRKLDEKPAPACSLEIGEELHWAGYGDVKEYCSVDIKTRKWQTISKDGTGLSRGRYKIEGVRVTTGPYYDSQYVARAVSRQTPNLTRYPERLTETLHKTIKGSGSGDSGGAWVAERVDSRDAKGNHRKHRIFALAVGVYGDSNSTVSGPEIGQDVMHVGDWIIDTMIDLWKSDPKDTL